MTESLPDDVPSEVQQALREVRQDSRREMVEQLQDEQATTDRIVEAFEREHGDNPTDR